MAQFQESAKYRKGYPEVKMKKLKEKALAYYQENKVPESLEMLLNKMYLNEPDDVYGYMVYSMTTHALMIIYIFL